jgi:CO/xanthine dehydrogenase FAD-binding subunit
VGLIQTLKKVKKPEIDTHSQLLKINELKEKNIITEEEFTKMKSDLLLVY